MVQTCGERGVDQLSGEVPGVPSGRMDGSLVAGTCTASMLAGRHAGWHVPSCIVNPGWRSKMVEKPGILPGWGPQKWSKNQGILPGWRPQKWSKTRVFGRVFGPKTRVFGRVFGPKQGYLDQNKGIWTKNKDIWTKTRIFGPKPGYLAPGNRVFGTQDTVIWHPGHGFLVYGVWDIHGFGTSTSRSEGHLLIYSCMVQGARPTAGQLTIQL